MINRLDHKNLETPYKGFSHDGHPDPTIFRYAEDEGAPVEEAVKAAEALFRGVSDEERKAVQFGDIETDDMFRIWSNPELYMNPGE